MQRQLLKSKLHRATITACDPDYVGSITIDAELMRKADLLPNEQVHVWDVENGARLVTYAIEGEPGSGQMQVNGAAARLVSPGDKVIVVSYAGYEHHEVTAHSPIVVHVDDRNRALAVDTDPGVLLADPAPASGGPTPDLEPAPGSGANGLEGGSHDLASGAELVAASVAAGEESER